MALSPVQAASQGPDQTGAVPQTRDRDFTAHPSASASSSLNTASAGNQGSGGVQGFAAFSRLAQSRFQADRRAEAGRLPAPQPASRGAGPSSMARDDDDAAAALSRRFLLDWELYSDDDEAEEPPSPKNREPQLLAHRDILNHIAGFLQNGKQDYGDVQPLVALMSTSKQIKTSLEAVPNLLATRQKITEADRLWQQQKSRFESRLNGDPDCAALAPKLGYLSERRRDIVAQSALQKPFLEHRCTASLQLIPGIRHLPRHQGKMIQNAVQFMCSAPEFNERTTAPLAAFLNAHEDLHDEGLTQGLVGLRGALTRDEDKWIVSCRDMPDRDIRVEALPSLEEPARLAHLLHYSGGLEVFEPEQRMQIVRETIKLGDQEFAEAMLVLPKRLPHVPGVMPDLLARSSQIENSAIRQQAIVRLSRGLPDMQQSERVALARMVQELRADPIGYRFASCVLRSDAARLPAAERAEVEAFLRPVDGGRPAG